MSASRLRRTSRYALEKHQATRDTGRLPTQHHDSDHSRKGAIQTTALNCARIWAWNQNLLKSSLSDKEAAFESREEISKFLKRIELAKKLRDVNMPQDEIEALADQSMVLPDYKANPRVATRKEMVEIISACY